MYISSAKIVPCNGTCAPSPYATALQVSATTLASGKTLASSATDYKTTYSGSAPFTESSMTIGGQAATKIVSQCEGVGCGNPVWLVINGGKLYTISSNLGYQPTFDKIVSTLKFTAVGVTAAWKTYSNSDYNFTFKYPTDWKLELGKAYPSTSVVDKIDFSANLTGSDGAYSYLSIVSKAYSGTALDYLAEMKKVDTANQDQGGPSHHFPDGTKVVLGSDWLKLSDVMTMAAKHDWYIKSNSGMIFVLQVLKQPGEGPITDISASIETANLIVSTFQFIK